MKRKIKAAKKEYPSKRLIKRLKEIEELKKKYKLCSTTQLTLNLLAIFEDSNFTYT